MHKRIVLTVPLPKKYIEDNLMISDNVPQLKKKLKKKVSDNLLIMLKKILDRQFSNIDSASETYSVLWPISRKHYILLNTSPL